MAATSKPSKKAHAIYEASEQQVRRDVVRGRFYDCARIEADELLCQRTLNDLRKVWALRCKDAERDLRLVTRYDFEDKSSYQCEVEVLRRMWLGIQDRQRNDVDWLKSL